MPCTEYPHQTSQHFQLGKRPGSCQHSPRFQPVSCRCTGATWHHCNAQGAQKWKRTLSRTTRYQPKFREPRVPICQSYSPYSDFLNPKIQKSQKNPPRNQTQDYIEGNLRHVLVVPLFFFFFEILVVFDSRHSFSRLVSSTWLSACKL